MSHDEQHGHPAPVDPAAGPSPEPSGRHREGREPRRRVARRPSFRTTVTVAGAATALLTVATGVYLTAPAPAKGQAPASPAAHRAAPPVQAEAHAPGTARQAASARTGQDLPGVMGTVAGRAAGFAGKVVSLVNAERRKAGCAPLRAEKRLRAAAQGHAGDMARRGYYQHDSPEGRNGGDRIAAAGYHWSTWAENIHRGPKTPARAMADWMDSPGHRANILNCSFKEIGVGVVLATNGPWWVQNFGARG